ncbi:ABC transporter ATP-binding protein [Paenibacillus sacheonensis]|uniref:ATP-binding cassette domain-containing protein n=1 Tax=Paenibacillus sacheonensis TaxID=742054 RepID=A0A7X5BYZ3_9BACL|nr:ABC transporter ATP-binding protein [Paenibacillus sacheonensis]MBM7568425.1 ATP-binding cassette subfamily B protein [Paenibacillus sacheonensis]NBC72123.1 ATP-binding cassette domain-containing protein [Paenibacillus sacheonensis]
MKSTTTSRLSRYALVYKYRIIAAILILCCAVGAELGGPYIAKTIIDKHLSAGEGDIGAVLRLLGLYMGLLLTASVCNFSQSYMLQATALRIIKNMRMDLMKHISRIPVRYFDNTPIGQVVSRIANDTEAIRDLFMSFMATFVVSIVQLIGIYTALFILDARLALFTLLLPPLFVVIMYVHLKFSKIYITIMRARLSDMNAMFNEMINVMPIIQAFRREKVTIAEFETLNNDRYVNQVKQFRVFSLSSRNIVGTIGGLLTAGVIWYFGNESLTSASISFGVFYAFIDYLGRIFQPIIGFFDQLMNAQRAFVSADKVFAIMDIEGTEVEEADGTARPEGVVKFDNVTFAYKEGENVLKGISFEARKGETLALVGHTGSGKSSIMNLLLGFYEPQQGIISIDGRDIRTFSKQSLRKHMGIVLQDPFLFAGDIMFNVSLYNKDITPDRVKGALREVGAASFIEQLPKGYNEPVVERGSTLSSGQRQLISFARALAFDPSILILDEATASIDSETEGLIQQALKVVSEGRTTLVIAHRLSTIRDADQILVLHRGEIVERGNHRELMALGGRYFKMYQLQTGESAAIPAKAAVQDSGTASGSGTSQTGGSPIVI